MKMRRGTLRVGTSGYEYEHWRKVFYPPDLPRNERFAFYCRSFRTVEINNTFYRLPTETIFERWAQQAPEGFVYALKFSRFGTHIKRLKDPGGPIDLFLERSRHLGPRLGPILVQLPSNMRVDLDRLRGFLDAAPRSHLWAVELRHESWLVDETYEILASHNAALVVHDRIPNHPRPATAGWHYQRFHGGPGEAYSRQALVAEARRLTAILDEGRDAWVYFNNDAEGNAIRDAADLERYVEQARRR